MKSLEVWRGGMDGLGIEVRDCWVEYYGSDVWADANTVGGVMG